ncbi:DUF1684 domain-containing protein [Chiayiivirga flava]|uniref:DUF1684 domain-containing protein n=1 Tax=Chiayiivirga flava TaxID=659595 RepID=A0A7W8D567_9GAMM|nr:DUF1684 domain-containing protein [Chiayiivirga flava]MBB5207000.1 hypothetical protein [Chiayiivirga flava]
MKPDVRSTTILLAAALLFVGAASRAADDAAYIRGIEQQRADRVERLGAPQGWLSLVGLHWIEPGTHRIGRAPDNAIVLATGPAHAGEVERTGATVVYRPASDAGITVDGHIIDGEVELAADTGGDPTVVAFDGGKATMQLIARGDRLGLRVRDERAATRTAFKGVDTYPIDPAWRIEARFIAHPPGKTIEIANVLDMLEPTPNPGVVVFEKDGREFRLEALDNGDGTLFLIFADRTNRDATYGAGRFLDTAAPADGRVTLDFNLAVNPPCAFNAYSTCPLPPPENRLDLAVTAGEKRYAATNH